jgi:xanthine dehydrogenase/oxidase
MEPHALMAVPGETYGEMEIISCTQCVTKTAKCVAGCLGVPESKVRCVVKRLGGGFGGKETLSIYRAGAIAIAAAKLKKAVRLVMTRDEDMAISGQSHPFDGKWTVGFDESGKVLACDVLLLNDAGCTICCSNVVMDRAVAHFANSYHLGAVRVVGKLAWTHLPSNTAFRGFGVPQSALVCEDMLEAIAASLCLHPDSVRSINFLPSGAHTHYGQRVAVSHTDRIWKDIRSTADLDARRDAIQAFNASHRWRKQGLAMIPTMYGVNFPLKYLNQAGAQVLVYTDGSVYITHAGVEMGQGLNTKIMQVAAQALGVDIADCHIAECSSDRVNNTSPTAASVGADLNGMATLHACEQIRDRLKPLREELGADKPFRDVCALAYKRQISLAAFGFYASPFGGVHRWRSTRAGDHLPSADRSPSSNAGRGDIFNYFAFGCAAAQVELDVLTGLFEVKRADLLMDVGNSLNAAIDIGQVEGAFVQVGESCVTCHKRGQRRHRPAAINHSQTNNI